MILWELVLFYLKIKHIDFGLLIPDYGVLCLCCGIVFDFDDVEILYNFNDVHYLEQAVASGGFYDELPDNLKALYTGAK